MISNNKFYESIQITDWESVRELLHIPANLQEMRENRDTLFRACSCAPAHIIKLIYDACPQQIKFRDEDGNTPLHNACASYSPESENVIQLLLDISPELVVIANYDGMLPLHQAILNRRVPSIIKKLLMYFPEGLICDANELLGNPAQLFFDEWLDELEDNKNNFNKLKEAPFIGPDGNDKDIVTNTFLAIIKASLHISSVSALKPSEILPVHSALNLKDLSIPPVFTQLMIKTFKEDATKTDENGNCPLHVGVSQKDVNPELIESLIEANPDVTTYPNRDGKIPLSLAIENGQRCEVIRPLLTVTLKNLYVSQ